VVGRPAMSDPRVDELEIRYSQLDRLVHELSDVIWRQQRELDSLRELTKQLRDKLQSDPGLVDASRNERPPHY
jgi:SlyX protein